MFRPGTKEFKQMKKRFKKRASRRNKSKATTVAVVAVEKKAPRKEQKSYQKKTATFGTDKSFSSRPTNVPLAMPIMSSPNHVTKTGPVKHKEWGVGDRFKFTLYLGTAGVNTSNAGTFTPVLTSAGFAQFPPYYNFPLHPLTLSMMNNIGINFSRYAFRELKVKYNATTATINNGGIVCALNRDIVSAIGSRAGSFTSGYIQSTPSINYHLSQDTHFMTPVWRSCELDWRYNGDRTWINSTMPLDQGLTETLQATEIEQYIQVIFWNRLDALASTYDLSVGHYELSGVVDFYEPRNSFVTMAQGIIGGPGTTTLSSTTLKGSTLSEGTLVDLTTSLRSFKAHGDEPSQDRNLDSKRLRSRSPADRSTGYDLGHPMRDSDLSHTGFLNPDLTVPKPPRTVREELTDSVILDRVGDTLNKLDLVSKSDYSTIKEIVKRSSSKGPPSST
jgi:hypothetical protein